MNDEESLTSENQVKQYVEVYNTTVHRRRGTITRIDVSVEYGDDDGSTKNTVTFECSGGVASLDSFETPITNVQDLRVVPAAETVARTVPGIQGVAFSFTVIEEVLNEGHKAVENRLEMDNVPEELREGFEMEDR